MQPIEMTLFGAVIALAAGLIGYILWLRARARGAVRAAVSGQRPVGSRFRSGSEAGAPSVVCPACQREYDVGLQFCPHDARELVPATDPTARAASPGMTCPSCRRSFDAMKRFCPFDGDDLVPLTLALGTGKPSATTRAGDIAGIGSGGGGGGSGVGVDASAAGGGAGLGLGIGIGIGMMAKICPHCSRRYESDATFCGRDGSALVSVN